MKGWKNTKTLPPGNHIPSGEKERENGRRSEIHPVTYPRNYMSEDAPIVLPNTAILSICLSRDWGVIWWASLHRRRHIDMDGQTIPDDRLSFS